MQRILALTLFCGFLLFLSSCSQSPTSPGSGSGWSSSGNAPFSGRYGAAGTVFNGSMWVIGGANSPDNGATTVYCKDIWSGSGSSWNSIGNLPTSIGGRYGSQVLSMGASMYLIGGNNSGNFKNDVWSSPNGVTWTNILANGPSSATHFSGREDFAAVVFNGLMWVIGGWDGTARNDVWSSPDGITWTKATANAQFSARWGISAVVYQNKMWILAGATGPNTSPSSAFSDAWYSDASGANWTQTLVKRPIPQGGFDQIYYYGLTVNNNSMVLVPGYYFDATSPVDPLNAIVQTSTDGVSWPYVTTSIPRRFYPVCLSFNGQAWVIGGCGYVQNGTQLVPTYYDDVWHSN